MPSSSRPKTKERDLLKAFDLVNAQYFGGLVCGGIGWRNLPMHHANSALALCLIEERFIKVGTVMSDSRIPDWYFHFVVFHEMLHLYVGRPKNPDGTDADPHSWQFQSLEMKHPDYKRAEKFEETKLPKILASWIRWCRDNKKKTKKASP